MFFHITAKRCAKVRSTAVQIRILHFSAPGAQRIFLFVTGSPMRHVPMRHVHFVIPWWCDARTLWWGWTRSWGWRPWSVRNFLGPGLSLHRHQARTPLEGSQHRYCRRHWCFQHTKDDIIPTTGQADHQQDRRKSTRRKTTHYSSSNYIGIPPRARRETWSQHRRLGRGQSLWLWVLDPSSCTKPRCSRQLLPYRCRSTLRLVGQIYIRNKHAYKWIWSEANVE